MLHLVDDKIIDNHFEVGKYSCGYSVIREVIKNYKYNIEEWEVFFLANGFCFQNLLETFLLGYKSLKETCANLMENTDLQIDLYENLSNSTSIRIIQEELKKGNLPILYVQSDKLSYHNIQKPLYPFHLIVSKGIDESFIDISDVYVIDDFGKISTFDGKVELIKILPAVKEIMVIQNSTEYTIYKKDFTDVIANDLTFFLQKSTHGLAQMKEYIRDLYNCLKESGFTKLELLPETLMVFKWIIVTPIASYIKCLCKKYRFDDIEQEIDELYNNWIGNLNMLTKCFYALNSTKALQKSDNFNDNIIKLSSIIENLKKKFNYL